MVKKWNGEKVFDICTYIILFGVMVICLFPLLYVVSVSLTPMSEVLKQGGFLVIPKKVTMDAYKAIFEQRLLPRSMVITAFVTVAGTAINMIFTTLMAYPLSKTKLPGRTKLVPFIVFTMLFNGGTIPTYLLIKNLHLIGTYWALLLPGAIWTYNLLVVKAFFENLPEELFESARIDGGGGIPGVMENSAAIVQTGYDDGNALLCGGALGNVFCGDHVSAGSENADPAGGPEENADSEFRNEPGYGGSDNDAPDGYGSVLFFADYYSLSVYPKIFY